MRDHYALLGLDQTATQAQIKNAFRAMMLVHHPDKSSATGLSLPIAILEAYSTLSNCDRRGDYDRQLCLFLQKETNKILRHIQPAQLTKTNHYLSVGCPQCMGQTNIPLHLLCSESVLVACDFCGLTLSVDSTEGQ